MDPNASEKQLKDASYKYIVWGDTGSRWKYSQSAYQYLLKEGSRKTTTIGPVQLGDRLSKGQDISGMISTKGVGYTEVTSLYGMRQGRLHKGIDIAAPAGTYIALRVDCEVVGTANDRGGYGLVIDVWVPQYGVQLRFGHCSKFLITSGKIPAGKSFAVVGSTGRSDGPHIHFEYTKEKNSTSKSDGDPSAYVPLILLTSYLGESASLASITKPSAAQITVTNNKQVAQRITTERQGEEVVVIRNKSAGEPTSPASIITSGMNMIPGGRELNTFIKDVLFLNLANS
jgi:murein DD-endopeptidase MepM/ murein hydrolase activator NlpD